MESTRLSDCLRDYLGHHAAASPPEWVQGTLEVVGQFFYGLVVPPTWHLREIQRVDGSALIWFWVSTTDQAVCPHCQTVSSHRTVGANANCHHFG